MAADAFPPPPDQAQPVAEQAGPQPASRDTIPTAAILSRQSTDFGLVADNASAADTILPAGPDPLVGHDLGEVVLGRLLGQGGMGRVYEARQRSPARTVAVKLMRPSRRSPAAVQRFRREADLLGRLRHPGIAQVFTAGSCRLEGEETPYFVLEFVPEAETLVRACERRRLSPRQRLETTRIVRNSPPTRLRFADRGLQPGADAIALKCLAKRPVDRYPSAAELAGDLDRLLAGRPISARVPGWTDACRSWCRRHPTATASGIAAGVSAVIVALGVWYALGRPSAEPLAVANSPGPTASIPNVSSLRTTPLQWLGVTFDEPVRGLSPADFRLSRDGVEVPLAGVTVTGERTHWEIRGLEGMTAAEGRYMLELAGTATTPVDFAGRRLQAPAQAVWRMPPYREIAFNLLGEEWKRHVVSMEGLEFATERNAGATSFIRPTAPDREGSIVLKFPAPFEIRAATLTARIAVWTTGDPFPYDPRARAALDVSADGKTWTTLEIREANRGGFGGGPFDIREVVAGSHAVWVRARLTASRSWPGDGLIHAQFLRTDPARPADRPFKLTLTGADPGAKPPPDDAPPADN